MLDQPGRLLMAALGFAGLPLLVRHRHVAVGMARQGYDLQLTRYDEKGWRATFYTTRMKHSPTSATSTAWQRTPWHAVQSGAWGTLRSASA